MSYSIERPKFQVYTTDEMINVLRQAAKHYNYRRFTRHEFDAFSTSCKGSAILNRFKTWQAALDATGLKLQIVKKINYSITNEQLFKEMERIWSEIGHRPSHDEWISQNPLYSYSTYKARFNGWVNACKEFIAFMSDDSPQIETNTSNIKRSQKSTKQKNNITEIIKRNVSDKLRYKVLARDKFKCVLCGRSPANEAGVKLHIDHIHPFSKSGETVIENLRSVCNHCNWGKGNDIEKP